MFDREITIEHNQLPKRYLKDDENDQGTQHIKRMILSQYGSRSKSLKKYNNIKRFSEYK